jgi:hypothetical protein
VALEDVRLSGFDCHFSRTSNFFKTTPLPCGAALDNFAKGGAFFINQVSEASVPCWNESDPEFRRLLKGIDDSP